MQIILLSSSRSGANRLPIGRFAILSLCLVVLLAMAGLFYGGMRMGADLMIQQFAVSSDASGPYWQRELREERTRLADLRTDTENNLNALAIKLGDMQARVTRLDALGQRLATMAKLENGEFDFSDAPGIGGPQEAPQTPNGITDISEAFTRLSHEIEDRTEKLTALESLLMNRKLQSEIFPGGVPIRGGWMSSGFGLRTDPISGRKEFHRGIDFTGRPNSKVLALAAGVVTWAGWKHEYGNVVEINHGNGYVTRYAHNKKDLVAVGDKVEKGQAIAIMGSTGRTTGPHVHFEVLQDGKIVNPVKYVQSAQDASKDKQVLAASRSVN